MKNIFALNIEKQSSQPRLDGDCFTTNRIDVIQQQTIDKTAEEFETQVKENSSPQWLKITITALFILGLIGATGIINALVETSLAVAFENAGWLFFASGISVLVGIVFFYLEKKKQKKMVESDEFQTFTSQIETSIMESHAQLGIPEDAQKIDVFGFSYVMKNGKVKLKTNLMFQYILIEWNAFVQNGNLCFADLHQVISIPLASIVRIQEVKKRIGFSGWNKEINYNKPPYKAFKYVENDYGTVYVKPYYSVQVIDAFGEFEFFIPPHELSLIRKWTGLDVKEPVSNRN
jgi:hypothetical protein